MQRKFAAAGLIVVTMLAAGAPARAADCGAAVTKIVTEHLGVAQAKVTPRAKIAADLGADELDTVELVMAAEEEFGIEIPDDDAGKLITIGDFINYANARAKTGCR